MTPKLNYTDASALFPNRKARRPFIGMMLMGLGFFLGLFQPAMAGGKPDAPPSVTIVKDYSVANSGNPDIFTVTFNPIPPLPMSLLVNVGTTSSFVVNVDANGVATILLTNTVVGSLPVTVTSQDGTVTYASVVVNFIAVPGPPDLSRSYIVATQPTNPADGSSQDVVQAVLFDQYGNPCATGTQVNFSMQSGTANMSPASGATTSTGNIATATFTSTTPGNVNVQAQVFVSGAWRYLNDQAQANNYVPIQFTILPPDITKSYIVGVVPSTAADGTSRDEVDAVVKNALGQNVPDGTVVTFTIKSGTATITTTGVTTGGIAKAYFTSTAVGSVDVQAQVDISGVPTFLHDQPVPANDYTTIQFTIPPPDVTKSYIIGVTTSTAADGTSRDEVDAVVKDALGNNVPDGTAVTFTIKSGTATIVLTTTVLNGVAQAFFTSTVIGAVDVQAQVTIAGVPTFLNDQNAPANNFTTIQFTQPPPSATLSFIVGITTSTLADGTSQNEVDALVNTATGTVPDGTVVTFTIKTGTATITTTGTTVGGVAKAYFKSTVVGSVDVQAQVTIGGVQTYLNDLNAPANNFTTIQFVAGQPVPGDPGGGGIGGTPPGGGGTPPGGGPGGGGNNNGPGSNNNFTLLFVRQDFRLADGKQEDSVIAFVTDAYHHPLKGITIQFLIQNAPTSGTATSGAKFTSDPTAVITDDSGMARISLTSTKPGTVFVNAVLIIQGVLIDGSYQIVTFTNKPDVNNPLTNLSVVIYEALADGVQQTMVKAHVVDLDGNIMAGQEVVFKVDSGDATIVTPAPVLTDANGDAYISIVSKKPGIAAITATIDGEKIIFGSPARVKFAVINIYVPKVFTPNNDGTNDLLKPILVGISTFHYWNIYNRWGNLIYTSRDPNRGWDGTWKGVAQPVETYVWIAEGVDVNGKTIVQKGMTSLVR